MCTLFPDEWAECVAAVLILTWLNLVRRLCWMCTHDTHHPADIHFLVKHVMSGHTREELCRPLHHYAHVRQAVRFFSNDWPLLGYHDPVNIMLNINNCIIFWVPWLIYRRKLKTLCWPSHHDEVGSAFVFKINPTTSDILILRTLVFVFVIYNFGVETCVWNKRSQK